MGGEKTLYSGMQQVVLGSSPRWRGKDRFLATQSLVLRITPAWAGKSGLSYAKKSSGKDHPRVGGEKQTLGSTGHDKPGSPPRGRGKVAGGVIIGVLLGITPAWAGKSVTGFHQDDLEEDHPRVGGEKHKAMASGSLQEGSPPRGRGKDAEGSGLHRRTGITPAWAGKSPTLSV